VLVFGAIVSGLLRGNADRNRHQLELPLRPLSLGRKLLHPSRFPATPPRASIGR
jgi:hypothetical protein